MASGQFVGLNSEQVTGEFVSMTQRPGVMVVFMVIIVVLCFGVCAVGLQKGVERVTKFMMISLFLMMTVLAVHSITLKGGSEGLKFYLVPDFGKLAEYGVFEVLTRPWVRHFSP